MQTAQLTSNGRITTEFFAVPFLFRCREIHRNRPKYPRSVICWDLFLYFLFIFFWGEGGGEGGMGGGGHFGIKHG